MPHPTTSDGTSWLDRSARELEGAHTAWDSGNAGMGRVCARRSAGMALKALLEVEPRADYGRSFMHHLNAVADDPSIDDVAVREAAWRLAARKPPAEGFTVSLPERLTPMHDAEIINRWCTARVGKAG